MGYVWFTSHELQYSRWIYYLRYLEDVTLAVAHQMAHAWGQVQDREATMTNTTLRSMASVYIPVDATGCELECQFYGAVRRGIECILMQTWQEISVQHYAPCPTNSAPGTILR